MGCWLQLFLYASTCVSFWTNFSNETDYHIWCIIVWNVWASIMLERTLTNIDAWGEVKWRYLYKAFLATPEGLPPGSASISVSAMFAELIIVSNRESIMSLLLGKQLAALPYHLLWQQSVGGVHELHKIGMVGWFTLFDGSRIALWQLMWHDIFVWFIFIVNRLFLKNK